ncbi:cytochrome P450 [Actinoplanes subtropicus]|uniref:cytochrome P450 n=1 Tax=Actinoplanes subtropicus TaxID=543632 RepID=UPI00146FF308|nr:cytochrome P450 [Actinoplanes subtropicus]
MRFDPFDIGYDRDPAAMWRRLLAEGPGVGFDPDLGLWIIAGYDNVRDVLGDGRRFSNATTLTPVAPLSGAALAQLAGVQWTPGIVSADPPRHAGLRSVLRSVVPGTAELVRDRWLPLLLLRAGQVAEELGEQGSVDLVDQVSRRLPLLVMLDVLGLPAEDATMIGHWTASTAELLWGRPTAAEQLAGLYRLLEFRDYCRALIRVRLTTPRPAPGVLGDLLAYRAGREARLAVEQAASLLLDLLLAGSAFTTAALGHALEHALADPRRWSRVAGDAHLRATLIEESLRFSPAVDGWLRLALSDTTVGGVTIPAGSRCLVLLGSAGHDETVYTDPQIFDPGRARLSRHLAFGYGPHQCPAAALARLQLDTALAVLALRLPALRLSADHVRRFRPSVAVRAHTAMPAVTVGSRCPVTHGGEVR